MTGRAGKQKGAAGERQLIKALNALIGAEIFKRNLDQSREGGADTISATPFALEIKRQERESYTPWIKQCKRQAYRVSKRGVLAHRKNGEEWDLWVNFNLKEFAEYVKAVHDCGDQSIPDIQHWPGMRVSDLREE